MQNVACRSMHHKQQGQPKLYITGLDLQNNTLKRRMQQFAHHNSQQSTQQAGSNLVAILLLAVLIMSVWYVVNEWLSTACWRRRVLHHKQLIAQYGKGLSPGQDVAKADTKCINCPCMQKGAEIEIYLWALLAFQQSAANFATAAYISGASTLLPTWHTCTSSIAIADMPTCLPLQANICRKVCVVEHAASMVTKHNLIWCSVTDAQHCWAEITTSMQPLSGCSIVSTHTQHIVQFLSNPLVHTSHCSSNKAA